MQQYQHRIPHRFCFLDHASLFSVERRGAGNPSKPTLCWLFVRLFSVQRAQLSFLLTVNVRLIKTFTGFNLITRCSKWHLIVSQMVLAEFVLDNKNSLMLTMELHRSKENRPVSTPFESLWGFLADASRLFHHQFISDDFNLILAALKQDRGECTFNIVYNFIESEIYHN